MENELNQMIRTHCLHSEHLASNSFSNIEVKEIYEVKESWAKILSKDKI